MKRIKFLWGLVGILLFCVGCNQVATEDFSVEETKQTAYIAIPDTSVNVEKRDVQGIVQRLLIKQSKTTRGQQTKTIKSIDEYKGKDGSVLFYAVNFANNQGFVLLSATKHTMPVLASGDEGNFTLDGSSEYGLSDWLQMTETEILDARADVKSLEKNSTLWEELTARFQPFAKTRYGDITEYEEDWHWSYIQDCICGWQNEGYTVYSVEDLMFGNFSDRGYEFDQAVLDLMANPMNSYFGRPLYKDAFVLVKYETIKQGVSPLIATTWHQFAPYNKFITNNYPVGCVAIALAQILNYHATMPGYDYNKMKPGMEYQYDECSRFVEDIARRVNTYDYTDTTGKVERLAFPMSVPPALNGIHYRYDNYVSFDCSKILASLDLKRPVFLGGNRVDGKGHAWVCDGYDNSSVKRELILMAPYGYPDDAMGVYIPEKTRFDYTTTPLRLHYNWGFNKGDNLGYYANTLGNQATQHSYYIDLVQMTNIRPGNNN